MDLAFVNFFLRRQIWFYAVVADALIYLAFLTVLTAEVLIVSPGMHGWKNVNSLYRTTAEGFADMGPEPRSPNLYSKLTFADVADAGDFW